MHADVSYYSSIGGRKNNEDSLSLLENGQNLIAVVADGLGGHASGEIASHLAVKTVIGELIGKRLSENALREAVDEANRTIINQALSNSMKTTIAVAWIENRHALFATVGDTRIYHFRNGEIIFQSLDHSVSQLAVMAGEISASQIRGHRDRNKLVQALGSKDRVKPAVSEAEPAPHDAVLVCSDGFWENIIENEMCRCLAQSGSAKEWLEKMKETVESAAPPNGDNHSAVALIITK